MKTILIILLLGPIGNLFAQCNQMFDYKEGTSWQWANYDKKGKLLGESVQKVEKYVKLDNGFELELSVVSTDKKGKQAPTVTMDMSCREGIVHFDMKNFIPDEYMGEMEAEVSGSNLEMPTNMKVGDRLKDASIKMALTMGTSSMKMNINVDIIDRKVEGEETLKTPAGEFACLIISQSIKTKAIISMEINSKEWYSQGVGMVRSESLKNGKLIGYSILTAFNK